MELQPIHMQIKAEPVDDYLEDINDASESSIVLKFSRNQNGYYSVMPFIKPDPFFEEDLGELTHNGLLKLIKEEAEPFDYPEINDFALETKLENLEVEIAKVENALPGKDILLERGTKPKIPISSCKIPSKKERICYICNGLNLGTHSVLEEHIFRFHRDDEDARALITRKIWQCEFCTYQSLSRTSCIRHLSSYNPKILKTRLLNKDQFSMEDASIENLKRALKIEFSCYDCSYKTNDKGSLTKHVRLHKSKNIQPYFCQAADCNKNFNEKASLDAHIIKRHYQNKRLIRTITSTILQCDQCKYVDVNKAKIIRHKKRHLKQKSRKKGKYNC